MIPEIGMIVGMYVCVRYLENLAGKSSSWVNAFSIIGGIITIICMLDFVTRGAR